jgi:hypothetical protein
VAVEAGEEVVVILRGLRHFAPNGPGRGPSMVRDFRFLNNAYKSLSLRILRISLSTIAEEYQKRYSFLIVEKW